MNDSPTDGAPGGLEVRIRAKTYAGADGVAVEALRGLSFSAAAGSVTALFGRSGCGKTTTLRIIAGLDRAFEGMVARPGTGRIGMVFQEPRLLPWRTVEANVRLALPPDRLDADLAPLWAMLGLGEHRNRYPGELSLGLARRAAIARAFALEPDLLLLDEPFASLDETTADRIRAELTALVERTRPTTVLVTHDLDEAILLSDRLLLLSDRPASVIEAFDLTRPRAERTRDWRHAMATRIRASQAGLREASDA